jgi:Domain of unknown function (DUF5050)
VSESQVSDKERQKRLEAHTTCLLTPPQFKALSLNGTHLFTVSSDATGCKLLALAHADSRLQTLHAAPELTHVHCDANEVYVAQGSVLVRVSVSNGVVTELFDAKTMVTSVCCDKEFVYASLHGEYPGYENGGVVRIPKSGGAAQRLVQGRCVGVCAVDDNSLFYSSGGTLCEMVLGERGNETMLCSALNPHSIVASAQHIYFTEYDQAGALCAFNRKTKARTAIFSAPYAWKLFQLGEWLYWSQSSLKSKAGAIWRIHLDVGAVPEVVARFRSSAPEISAQNERVAWIDESGCVMALNHASAHIKKTG